MRWPGRCVKPSVGRGATHGGDELTDAPAEEFLELDGGRVHLLRSERTVAASGRDTWSGWGAARPGRARPVRALPARASGGECGALRNARPGSSRPPSPHPCGRQAEPASRRGSRPAPGGCGRRGAPPPARSAGPRSTGPGPGAGGTARRAARGTGITLMGDTVARGLRAARQPSLGVSEQ